MGIFDSWAEILEAALPWQSAEAEAPKEQEEGEESEDKSEGSEEKEEGEEKEEEPEEEEEEEEEIVDPKETLETECKESKACAPAKHHFDDCVDRVTGTLEGKHNKAYPGEDCVEEFFHLAHCASSCAAPKLWSQLK